MKNKIVKTVSIISGIVAVIGVIFILTLGGQEWRRFFNPREENIRREVFEQTRSYNQAKIQELSKYRLEYLRSQDETEKQAIASTVRHTFADYNDKNLSLELREFLRAINH